MIHSDEDDEFERIEHEIKMKGQPYHFDPVFVSVSQRNQVLEEAAKMCEIKAEVMAITGKYFDPDDLAKAIRGMKK